MDQTYWLLRGQAEQAKAREAATSQSRLVHYDLAGRYSVKAALGAPFLLPSRGPATEGEREALRLPLPAFRKFPGLPGGRKRGAGKDAGR